MNRKVNFDKKHLTSLAEVGNAKALTILRMAVDGDAPLIYFLNKETFRILEYKDADAMLASFPSSIEIYPDGKPDHYNADSFVQYLIPKFSKILSPNNVYFLDLSKKESALKKYPQSVDGVNHDNENTVEQVEEPKATEPMKGVLKKKKKPTLVRAKLEKFVEHLIVSTEYKTFKKFEDIMKSHYLLSKNEKIDDSKTYNDHAEVKRVFCIQSKRITAAENIVYKVHFCFENAAGENGFKESRALSSFKNIFDTVIARLKENS